MIVEVKHPERGAFKTVGNPIRLSDSVVDVETSPGLGEHNAEIFGDLGISTEELDELKSTGII